MMNYELTVFKERLTQKELAQMGMECSKGPVGDRAWQVLSVPSQITDVLKKIEFIRCSKQSEYMWDTDKLPTLFLGASGRSQPAFNCVLKHCDRKHL